MSNPLFHTYPLAWDIQTNVQPNVLHISPYLGHTEQCPTPYLTHLPSPGIYRPMSNPLFYTPLDLEYTDQCQTPYFTHLSSSGIYRTMPNPLFYTSPLTWDIQSNTKPPILHISPHLEYIDQRPTPYCAHHPSPGIYTPTPNPYFTHLPSPGIYRTMPNPLFYTFPLTLDIHTNAQPPILHTSPHLEYTEQCPTPYFTHLPSPGIYRTMPNPLFYTSPLTWIYRPTPNPLFYTFPLTWDIQTNAQPPILHISPHLGYTDQCPTPYFTHLPLPGIYRPTPNPLFYTFPLTWDIQTNAQPPILHISPHLGYTDQRPTPYFTHLPSPGIYRPTPNPLFYTFPLTWDIHTNAQPPILQISPYLGYTHQRPTPYFTNLPSPGIYRPMPSPLFYTSPLIWDIQTNAQPPILHISPHLGYTDQCPAPYFTHLPSSGIYRPTPNPLFYTPPLTWDLQNNAQPPILHISPHLGYTDQCPTPYFTHLPSPGTYKTMPNPLLYTASLMISHVWSIRRLTSSGFTREKVTCDTQTKCPTHFLHISPHLGYRLIPNPLFYTSPLTWDIE